MIFILILTSLSVVLGQPTAAPTPAPTIGDCGAGTCVGDTTIEAEDVGNSMAIYSLYDPTDGDNESCVSHFLLNIPACVDSETIEAEDCNGDALDIEFNVTSARCDLESDFPLIQTPFVKIDFNKSSGCSPPAYAKVTMPGAVLGDGTGPICLIAIKAQSDICTECRTKAFQCPATTAPTAEPTPPPTPQPISPTPSPTIGPCVTSDQCPEDDLCSCESECDDCFGLGGSTHDEGNQTVCVPRRVMGICPPGYALDSFNGCRKECSADGDCAVDQYCQTLDSVSLCTVCENGEACCGRCDANSDCTNNDVCGCNNTCVDCDSLGGKLEFIPQTLTNNSFCLPSCVSNNDCASLDYVCFNNVCQLGCSVNSDCDSPNEYCQLTPGNQNNAGICVLCDAEGGCCGVTSAPTPAPTPVGPPPPTVPPTPNPTTSPTSQPTASPTAAPTSAPTAAPTTPPIVGACCVDLLCVETVTEDSCLSRNGTYAGDETTCADLGSKECDCSLDAVINVTVISEPICASGESQVVNFTFDATCEDLRSPLVCPPLPDTLQMQFVWDPQEPTAYTTVLSQNNGDCTVPSSGDEIACSNVSAGLVFIAEITVDSAVTGSELLLSYVKADGTPEKRENVVLDTGSTNITLPTCTAPCCLAHTRGERTCSDEFAPTTCPGQTIGEQGELCEEFDVETECPKGCQKLWDCREDDLCLLSHCDDDTWFCITKRKGNCPRTHKTDALRGSCCEVDLGVCTDNLLPSACGVRKGVFASEPCGEAECEQPVHKTDTCTDCDSSYELGATVHNLTHVQISVADNRPADCHVAEMDVRLTATDGEWCDTTLPDGCYQKSAYVVECNVDSFPDAAWNETFTYKTGADEDTGFNIQIQTPTCSKSLLYGTGKRKRTSSNVRRKTSCAQTVDAMRYALATVNTIERCPTVIANPIQHDRANFRSTNHFADVHVAAARAFYDAYRNNDLTAVCASARLYGELTEACALSIDDTVVDEGLLVCYGGRADEWSVLQRHTVVDKHTLMIDIAPARASETSVLPYTLELLPDARRPAAVLITHLHAKTGVVVQVSSGVDEIVIHRNLANAVGENDEPLVFTTVLVEFEDGPAEMGYQSSGVKRKC